MVTILPDEEKIVIIDLDPFWYKIERIVWVLFKYVHIFFFISFQIPGEQMEVFSSIVIVHELDMILNLNWQYLCNWAPSIVKTDV